MTFKERLHKALNQESDTQLDELLMYAYYAGRTDSARDICDRANERYRTQMARASACRYHRMALKIVGADDSCYFVYSPDYAGDYKTLFGDDEWND